jgi:hypothetical protein
MYLEKILTVNPSKDLSTDNDFEDQKITVYLSKSSVPRIPSTPAVANALSKSYGNTPHRMM